MFQVDSTPVDVCNGGNDFICDWVYDQTGNETLAEALDWVVERPLKVIAILVIAYILNRLVRRAILRAEERMVRDREKKLQRRTVEEVEDGRFEDSELRAFANVCRHRGSLVCLEARGKTRKFSCPYHGWMYGLDGRLTAARDMPAGFDREAHGLKPLSFDVVHGLMFVAFTPEPPSLDVKVSDPATHATSFITERRDRLERRLRDWTSLASHTDDPIGVREAVARARELGILAGG